MPTSFNLEELEPDYVQEILMGLEGVEDSVFAQVFDTFDVTTMSGKLPFMKSKYTLASDDEYELGQIPFSESPDSGPTGLDDVAFEIGGKYAESETINEVDVETAANIQSNVDLVEQLGQIVLYKIAGAMDLDGKDFLQDTSKHSTVSANAAWSNSSSADPLNDMQKAVDKVGNPDVAWLGIDKARELAALDQFQVRDHEFDGTNARTRLSDVAAEIRSRFQIEDVVIDTTHYNENNQAQSLSDAYIFDGTVFLANSDHITVPVRPEFERAGSNFDDESGNYKVYAQKVADIAYSLESTQSVIITGT